VTTGHHAQVDAVIVGGGPAGATAAALLAEWGRSVVLVHYDPGRPSLAESLPWSTRKLLRHFGQLEAIDAARFHPNYGNISRWAGRPATAATDGPGYHVLRRDFDRVLRDHARAKSALIVEGFVNRVDLSTTPRVECVGADGVRRFDARFVLDCSGRTGVIARRGLRQSDAGYRTLAIAAEWECPTWPAEERTHTFVDSYQNGWAWSIPLSPTRRQCTVMIDAGLTAVRKAALEALYRSELRKAVSIEARLAGSRQVSAAWGCDASLYRSTRAAESSVLLVGDAASFIEPLSSAGVKKALASAWRAAVAVNTVIASPTMLDAASAFHDRREQQLYAQCARRAAAFFKSASAVYDDPFWTVRADDSASGSHAGEEATTDEAILRDPAVRCVVDDVRAAGTMKLTVSPTLAFDAVPVVEGNKIVLREAIVIPGFVEPVRFACGVNLPELVRIASASPGVSFMIQSYYSRINAVDPRNLLVGLAFLVTKGVLVKTFER
jgi:flavin-dependent dehydrogenase